jgi:hypothetical protein
MLLGEQGLLGISRLSCTHGIWKYPLFLVPRKISYPRKPPYELLVWGYRQYGIANTSHMSQPTASRDIHYIQKEIRKSTENYGEHLVGVYTEITYLD